MRTISETPLNEIAVGLRVKSNMSGIYGNIVHVSDKKYKDQIGLITVNWDNGGVTSLPHYDPEFEVQPLTNVVILDEQLGIDPSCKT